MIPDAAHTDPTLAELHLDLAAKRVTKSCRCQTVVTPAVTLAEAMAALDCLERHATGCSSAILALKGYLALPHD